MKEFTVQVARDRTEYVTVKVRAENPGDAEEAGLKKARDLRAELWSVGGDCDSPYVTEVK